MRKETIELVKELLNTEDLSSKTEELAFLKREYRRSANFEGENYFEKTQVEEFVSLYQELAKKEPSLLKTSADEKRAIIEQAKALLEKDGINNLSKDMNALLENFKHSGRGSKEEDDALWEEMRNIQKQAHDKINAHYDEIRKGFEDKKNQKLQLIEEAKKILEIKNIKEAGAKFDSLMEQWKKVGFAGKDDDEALWQQFSEVRKQYNEKRKEHFENMKKVFEDRVSQKEEMIKLVKKITADAYFTDEEVKQIKDLRNKWRDIGFAGKDKDDELWEQFNAAVKQYFDEMKFYKI